MRALSVFASCLLLGLATACKDSSGPDREPVTVGLTCQAPTGGSIPCDIDLGNATSFRVTLVSTDCTSPNNVVRLTLPVAEVLTANGCSEADGRAWTRDAPATPPRKVSLEITASAERNPPELRVEGEAPTWTIRFEDGYDTDFNDIVLRIEAL